MVDKSNPENLDITNLPPIENAQQMTEHERRLKRAARFGIDSSTVVGPSTVDASLNNMDISVSGQARVDRLNENI